MRKALLFVVAVFTMALSFEVTAQQRVITGTVISEEDGLGLPGATVLVKGTTVGTTTDLDGNYSINVPAGSDVLIFSFVGLKAQEEAIGSRSVVNVTLTVDAAQLSEVVVTAIGIEREKKALGYAVTSVSSTQLENRPESDVARVVTNQRLVTTSLCSLWMVFLLTLLLTRKTDLQAVVLLPLLVSWISIQTTSRACLY